MGATIHAILTTPGATLNAAATEGDEECLRILLDHGGDLNQDCGELGTALQAAADAADLDCINVLLKAETDVNKGTPQRMPLLCKRANAIALKDTKSNEKERDS